MEHTAQRPQDSASILFYAKVDAAEILPPDLRRTLEELNRVVQSTRTAERSLNLGELRRYGEWNCPRNEPCRHPNTPETRLFAPPSDWF